ncbi:MAG: hypothetical protein KF745_04905 [Phycisphaeraceae bacterium]|nr:hypothetical protein [Phycisphaeraceae bacterium]
MRRWTTATAVRAVAGAGALSSLLALGACVDNQNNDLTIGSAPDRVTLPALETRANLASAQPPIDEAPPPSVVGVMRDNWQRVTFKVPIEYVSHQATSATNPTYTDENARQLGQYPTEASCVERPTSRSYGDEAWEGLAAPFYCGLDVVMALPRMFVAPPWTLQRSPGTAYERRPDEVPAFYKIAPAGQTPAVDPAGAPSEAH